MILSIHSCKTTKKKGEMGRIGKSWHDMNSRFNGYYNADVIYNESIAALELEHQDNFNKLLPIYPSISVTNPESQAAELDRAIEKVAVVSNLHPGSKWVDDCYVMMGKTQYLKQDYESAEETLKFFSENFNPADPDSRVFNANTKKDPNADRRQKAKDEKKIRDIERKKAEEEKEEDNKIKEALRKAEDKIKGKIKDVKEEKREFLDKRRKEYADLRDKQRSLRDSRKKDNDKAEKSLKDKIKSLKEDLTKAQRKERETERERKLKEREKAAKENTRTTRTRKTDTTTGTTTTQTTAVPLSKAEALQQQVDQKEAELEALREKEIADKAAQAAADEKALEDHKLETARLEESIVKKEEDIAAQSTRNKKTEEEPEDAELNPFDEAIAEANPEGEEEKQEDKIKTRDNIGKSGFMRHRPAYAEGQFWLAMTYIERQNFFLAEYLLKTLEENPEISKDVAKQIPAAKAHLYLMQNRQDKAVPALEIAMDKANRKQDRARYAFILAQLMEKRGQYAEASNAFDRAKDLSREYSMKFNAQLAMLRTSWLGGLATMDNTQKQLNKLTKDIKNYDFLDQIYFTKAELKLADGDTEGALADFQEATKYGSSSPERKAESFYRLASLFYSTDDYVNAKLYYDSTMQVLPEKDERYADVKRLNDNLTSVAENSAIVVLQDSLLTLASLSEDQLQAWAEAEYDRNNVDEEPTENAPKIQAPNIRKPSFGNQGNSSFFAYNKLVVDKGKFDFERKWGDRPSQDNWRRSSAISTTALPSEDLAAEAAQVDDKKPNEEIEKILRDVPITQAQKDVANQKLQMALFGLGTDLRNNLGNYEKSNETFVSFIERYPDSEKLIDVYYYLYLNHQELNNPAGANIYLSLIKSEFPDSDFAKALDDPTYAARMETEEKKLDDYYEETYRQFEASNYQNAYDSATQSTDIFGAKNEYVRKFDLLAVMSKGALDGKDFYITGLRDFIARHPNTEETTRASEILRFLRGNQNAFDADLYQEQIANFTRQDEKLHYIVYVISDCDLAKMKKAKIAVANYNTKFFKLAKLRISNLYLNPEEKSQMILIRSFENKDKALDYMTIAARNVGDFLSIDEFQYEMFAVTQNNYREIVKQKTIENYKAFYDIHYVQ